MFRSSNPISKLFDQDSFDAKFLKDISRCSKSLLIESPFIRQNRIRQLLPLLSTLRMRGVQIVINTRNPEEHDLEYLIQAEEAISIMQNIGVKVLYTVKHHRKIAVIDKEISWEGSLNILSYYDSCEIMRRTESAQEAEMLIQFIGMQQYLASEV